MSDALISPKKGFIGYSGEFYTDSDNDTPKLNITRRKGNKSRGTQKIKKYNPPKGLDNNYELDEEINLEKQNKPMPNYKIVPVDYNIPLEYAVTPEDNNNNFGGRKSGRRKSDQRKSGGRKNKTKRTKRTKGTRRSL
jgi:hypothetical protein